ncbi:MAG: reverse transcriptase domain-containing protein, partial [Bacteroidota bacterium]
MSSGKHKSADDRQGEYAKLKGGGGLARSSVEDSVMELERRGKHVRSGPSSTTSGGGTPGRKTDWYENRGLPITLKHFLDAYLKVKRNRGSHGVDRQSLMDFESHLVRNLYRLWNRVSSGSYFPPAVREKSIPKADGKVRNVSHEKLGLALDRHVSEPWIRTLIYRWLTAPIQNEDGQLRYRQGRGTPQGGVISPLLANLYLHYALDSWLEAEHPQIKFVRYADDVIVHCHSYDEAIHLRNEIALRLRACELELNLDKTQVVFCKRTNRRYKYRLNASKSPLPMRAVFCNFKVVFQIW